MTWHIIQGKEGCDFAKVTHAVAVVVDALRASATAAMMFHAGAKEIFVVKEVEQAYQLRERFPDALLFGERNGLPPAGFDGGNSPREVDKTADKTVIFTTTTGANRLIQSWGAKAVFMGSTVNAQALIRATEKFFTDVVLIPAGLTEDPLFPADEDWVAATFIALQAGARIGEGFNLFTKWKSDIGKFGIEELFMNAPHADKLREIGMEEDIRFCAQVNITTAVPYGIEWYDYAVRCVDHQQYQKNDPIGMNPK